MKKVLSMVVACLLLAGCGGTGETAENAAPEEAADTLPATAPVEPISAPAVVTAGQAPEVVAATPLDRIVVETDAPYMSPVPNRGKRNDSRNLPYIVEKLAEWKGISPEEMAQAVWNNGLRLFGLEGKV